MTVWESYCHALEKEGLISVSSPKFCAVYQKFLSRQQDKISCRVRFLKALLSIIHIHRVEENPWRCGIGTLGSSFHERWFFFRILCSCSRTLARICVVAFVLDHVRRIRNWTTVCGSYAKIGEECVTPSLPPFVVFVSLPTFQWCYWWKAVALPWLPDFSVLLQNNFYFLDIHKRSTNDA